MEMKSKNDRYIFENSIYFMLKWELKTIKTNIYTETTDPFQKQKQKYSFIRIFFNAKCNYFCL